MNSLQLFPDQASSFAADVDLLYYFMTAVSAFFIVLIFVLVILFAIRYRRRSDDERPRPIHGSLRLEMTWIVIPLFITMVMFVWGSKLYFDLYTPPTEALEIYVVGKQWMWKVQHPTGQREINRLHIPVGKQVKLIMSSEDVIHSFYIPAFRTKKDVVPGRYNVAWFEATRPGEYHLFCAEYCGTEHSRMIGSVVAMDPLEYEEWLSGGAVPGESLIQGGEKLFAQHGCVTCHEAESGARGPSLYGIFGTQVRLIGGETVMVDEAYLRQSILNPASQVLEGYPPIMPSFQGQVNEEGLNQLIAYIKSLRVPMRTQPSTEEGPGGSGGSDGSGESQ